MPSPKPTPPQLLIEVLTGPQSGQSLRLTHNYIIGRRRKGFFLKDPRISQKHARVESTPQGWYLVDLNSSNGVWHKRKKVQRLRLEAHTLFSLGSTLFTTKVVPDPKKLSTTPAPQAAQKLSPPFGPMPSQDQLRRYINQGLEWIQHEIFNLQDGNLALEALRPPRTLSFESGQQKGCKWLISYAPRVVGRSSPDLVICEPLSPDTCFELLPHPKGVLFKTQHPEQVLLNQKKQSEQLLKRGDRIQIGAFTHIVVE